MATFIEAFGNEKGQTKILIPLLQRDYVQGGSESVISPFLDQLLSGKEVDLNYIYGYEEDGCFIPIDGQQRLITLWLLHLYILSIEEVNASFPVDLSFKGREFANDFCVAIKEHLQKALHSVEETGKLSDVLKDQSWFMTSWLSSLTVRCMLKTLDYIHRFYKPNSGCTWQMLTSEDCKITFSFLKMDGKDGLDDDIYIKMNGRGRALSDFENLKSWMDEHVCFEKDNNKKVSVWKVNMDNKWTDFFWKNRNLHQEHPEEIDDEQLFCFCNLLILYWMLNQEKLQKNIDELDEFGKEELVSLFAKINEPSDNNTKDLQSKIYDYLREGNMFPLVWIERLKLMDDKFFEFAKKSLETLAGLTEKLNQCQDRKSDKYLYFGETENNSFTYNLALCKGTYSKSLPLLYAILLLCNARLSDEELYQRLRVIRNLIENTSIDKNDLIKKIFPSISELKTKLEYKIDILSYLSKHLEAKDILKGFSPTQVKEEILKAKYAQTSLMANIEEMENSSFFRGKITCMFNFLQDKEGYDSFTTENFRKYKDILMTIFPSKDDGGVAYSLDDQEFLLRRALLSMPAHDYGFWHSGWSYCQNSEEWRSVLGAFGDGANYEAIRQLTQLLAANTSKVAVSNIHDFLKKYVDLKSAAYYNIISGNKGQIYYWMYFVSYPDIWQYMRTKVIRWENDNNIFLKTSNGNNSNKMELRTYGLYLDFLETSIHEAIKKIREGWKLNCWPKEDTCIYFNIDVTSEEFQNVKQIQVDVFHNRTKEDDYVYNLFVRTKEGEASANLNKEVFLGKRFKKLMETLGLSQVIEGNSTNMTARIQPKETYSRAGIIKQLSILLPGLRDVVKNNSTHTVEMG